jgi:nucleoside-diphosphate-sugar epimerase
VHEVVELIFKKCGNEQALEVILQQMRTARTTGELSIQYMDFDVVQKDFGWTPSTSFEDGIDQTISWFGRYLAN